MGDKLIITPKPPKWEDDYKIFSVRIKNQIYEKLEKIAGETGRSRNEIVMILLEDALERLKYES